MLQEIADIAEKVKSFELKSNADLENYKREISGKNGRLNDLFEKFKTIPGDQKKDVGKALNELKILVTQKFEEGVHFIESTTISVSDKDETLPGKFLSFGKRHPLNLVNEEVIDIFEKIGFITQEGPEVEDDWHNFSALNFPANHPARDMQDTFFVNKENNILLRTHTSSVQVRTMMNEKPPIRIISPGRVYRCDSDATHSPVFHQCEGLYIDKNVSFSDLKDVLFYFVRSYFGENTKVRFRPSYFPFTEPSAEMDIGWTVDGKFKWMEILGCGMVDPNVLKNCGIDPEEYTGYAFGMGIERLTMLRYKISDIRLFYENDLRFIDQF
jgi:phenylalanyl-tRNA synthetase alpha chain